MIQLRSDCLIFRTAGGETLACNAELVAAELLSESKHLVDPEVVRQAVAAVLHYFREEVCRLTVSVPEFSDALARALRGFGLTVVSEAEPAAPAAAMNRRVTEVDLCRLAVGSGKGCELFFFPLLRSELRARLRELPEILRFKGLRRCVKQLVGARRWTARCQVLNDEIVTYLRRSFCADAAPRSCALIIQ